MICDLCLIKCEDPIQVDSDEENQCKIVVLLQRYFTFCLSEDFNYRYICRSCLSYVETFHEFCTRIEGIQQSRPLEIAQSDFTYLADDTNDIKLGNLLETKTENELEEDVDFDMPAQACDSGNEDSPDGNIISSN